MWLYTLAYDITVIAVDVTIWRGAINDFPCARFATPYDALVIHDCPVSDRASFNHIIQSLKLSCHNEILKVASSSKQLIVTKMRTFERGLTSIGEACEGQILLSVTLIGHYQGSKRKTKCNQLGFPVEREERISW